MVYFAIDVIGDKPILSFKFCIYFLKNGYKITILNPILTNIFKKH